MPASDTDSELLLRWRSGDGRAGEELFSRYFEPIERFFLNKINDNIDDLLQETFLRCVQSRDRVVEPKKFRSYLFAIAFNVLANHLREKYRRGDEVDFENTSIFDLSPGPSSIAARRDEERLLLDALRVIPLQYQVIIELYYWESMTSREIADVLSIPSGTARTRLQRARALLEEAIGKLGRTPQLTATTNTHLDEWAEGCRLRLNVKQTEENNDAEEIENAEDDLSNFG
ncbi:MAG: hypothetical protein Tsb0020_15530 [Haliangiales bacterium]